MISDPIRNVHLWIPGYIKARLRQRQSPPVKHVWLVLADHFEPLWKRPDEETARRRVEMWRHSWPEIAARHRDSAGRAPCYTFFYPEEEYRPYLLSPLAEMVETGIADVEVHIHHDGEGEENFVNRIRSFTHVLFHQHGLLRKHNERVVFGFIHGNWALDNSLPDGRWCGLNNELVLLRDLGCYADFTLPSAPSPAQTRMVNTIYWATDDPERPKSHDTGVPVKAGGAVAGDLMMIPGPLGFNWLGRRRWLAPRVETGELAASNPPTRHRARLWSRYAPHLAGNIFIKLFTHGAQEKNADVLLKGGLDLVFDSLQAECAERQWQLHFVSAWQMWQAIEAVRQQRDPLTVLIQRPGCKPGVISYA